MQKCKLIVAIRKNESILKMKGAEMRERRQENENERKSDLP